MRHCRLRPQAQFIPGTRPGIVLAVPTTDLDVPFPYGLDEVGRHARRQQATQAREYRTLVSRPAVGRRQADGDCGGQRPAPVDTETSPVRVLLHRLGGIPGDEGDRGSDESQYQRVEGGHSVFRGKRMDQLGLELVRFHARA